MQVRDVVPADPESPKGKTRLHLGLKQVVLKEHHNDMRRDYADGLLLA